MTDISRYLISPSVTVLEAMSFIDSGAKGIAFVCSDEHVLAVVTDGDIRRYILHGGDLHANVLTMANRDFKYLSETEEVNSEVLAKIKGDYKALPVLDSNGALQSIVFADETALRKSPDLQIPVVIMAGGKGTRLYPYTKVLPKPLIPIGDLPITMHIIQRFGKYGCNRFMMVVNHQKELIKAYYADPEIPYDIDFADEGEPLGTAGGLKLLEGKINSTFYLTNCDILVDADYQKIYQHHKQAGNVITVVCAVKNIIIPYGTIQLDDNGYINQMVEKPTLSHLVNTGCYLIEPDVLDIIPAGTFIHMPEVIQKCMDDGKSVGVYPISEEQWQDMGQIDEMEKMQKRLEIY